MSIAIFIFTLAIAFVVYKFVNKEEYTSKKKPLWKNLIYWGIVLFISIIFNMLTYYENNSSFNIAAYLNDQTMEMIVALIISCLVIQLISPSVFLGKIIDFMKRIMRGLKSSKKVKEGTSEDESTDIKNISWHKEPNVYSINKSKYQNDYEKEFQEKDFELLLNVLCWLSLSFAVFVQILIGIALWRSGGSAADLSINNQLSQSVNIQQLRAISNIILFFTVPISLRQVLYYLAKLRKSPEASSRDKELNSPEYEKYLLIQKQLNGMHKKL